MLNAPAAETTLKLDTCVMSVVNTGMPHARIPCVRAVPTIKIMYLKIIVAHGALRWDTSGVHIQSVRVVVDLQQNIIIKHQDQASRHQGIKAS